MDIARVLGIIARVGFKEELAGGGKEAAADLSLEAAIVQDADRWDTLAY